MELRRAWIFGCGYLGTPVARLWLASGVDVTVMTRSAEKAAALRGLGADAVVASRGVYALPERDPDVVLWSVGYERGDSPTNTREEAWVGGIERLGAELAGRRSPRLVYVSTTGVYGAGAGATLDESAPPAPVSEGGRVALAAELAVRRLAKESVALRLAGIIGPGRLLQPLDDIRRGMVIRAPADHWLNLVHVDDAARLVDVLARRDRAPSIINGAMLETPTRRAYYEGLARRLGAPPPRFEPSGPAGPNRRLVSSVRPGILPFRCESVERALDAMV